MRELGIDMPLDGKGWGRVLMCEGDVGRCRSALWSNTRIEGGDFRRVGTSILRQWRARESLGDLDVLKLFHNLPKHRRRSGRENATTSGQGLDS